MVRVDLRTIMLDIPPQDLITRDNVPAKVNAVTYFRVVDAVERGREVEQFLTATSQIAQTTLRSVLGKADLDMLLGERERLNEALQQIIDEQTDPWGVKVTTVEIKDVEIPRRDAARDGASGGGRARAPREGHQRRGRVPGLRAPERRGGGHERQPRRAAAALPADAHSRSASSQTSTIVFPLPIDLLKPLLQATQYDGTEKRPPPRPAADDTAEATLEAANGAREIAGGDSGHETREELDAEVEAELEAQAERVKAEVDRVQADLERRKT